jgi:hypothetical protein
MYYISALENNCALSVVKKRLGDFKGTEGEQYHVRTARGLPEGAPRGAWGVKQNVLPVVREPWGVGRGEGVAFFG